MTDLYKWMQERKAKVPPPGAKRAASVRAAVFVCGDHTCGAIAWCLMAVSRARLVEVDQIVVCVTVSGPGAGRVADGQQETEQRRLQGRFSHRGT